MEILFPPAVQVQPRLPPALLALLELAGPLTKSIYTLLFCLSVCLPLCPFVSNKCQNGWTDRVQILYGTKNCMLKCKTYRATYRATYQATYFATYIVQPIVQPMVQPSVKPIVQPILKLIV